MYITKANVRTYTQSYRKKRERETVGNILYMYLQLVWNRSFYANLCRPVTIESFISLCSLGDSPFRIEFKLHSPPSPTVRKLFAVMGPSPPYGQYNYIVSCPDTKASRRPLDRSSEKSGRVIAAVQTIGVNNGERHQQSTITKQ